MSVLPDRINPSLPGQYMTRDELAEPHMKWYIPDKMMSLHTGLLCPHFNKNLLTQEQKPKFVHKCKKLLVYKMDPGFWMVLQTGSSQHQIICSISAQDRP